MPKQGFLALSSLTILSPTFAMTYAQSPIASPAPILRNFQDMNRMAHGDHKGKMTAIRHICRLSPKIVVDRLHMLVEYSKGLFITNR